MVLTDEEQEIIDKIVELHNLYVRLSTTHPSDITEWVTSIHNLQKIMGMRILRRHIPETFPSFTHQETN